MGVPENVYVTSPTFTLINEYPGRLPVYHVDLYRISERDELVELGLDDILGGDGVVVIEWAEKLPGRYLKYCNVNIELVITGPDTRKIRIKSCADAVIDEIKKEF